MPAPYRKPRNAARPGEASGHNANSKAGDSTASGNRSNGANASGSNTPAANAATSAAAGGKRKGLLLGFLPACLFNRSHFQEINAAAVGAQHLETLVIDVYFLAAARDMSETAHDQTAHGIDFLVRELTVEARIEIGQRHQRLDHVFAAVARHDHDVIFDIVLAPDPPPDRPQPALGGPQPPHPAIFVHDDRHVVTAGAK